MKKISLALAALTFSGLASAVPLSSSGTVTVLQCTNLNEDVKINLTAGVVAGVDCTATRVALAACHTAGMLKSRSVGQKTITEQDADGKDVEKTISCTVGEADKDCKSVPVQGAAVPSSTTNYGTVNTQYPGTGACSTTVAENVAKALQ